MLCNDILQCEKLPGGCLLGCPNTDFLSVLGKAGLSVKLGYP
jgi:hypothetical protein